VQYKETQDTNSSWSNITFESKTWHVHDKKTSSICGSVGSVVEKNEEENIITYW